MIELEVKFFLKSENIALEVSPAPSELPVDIDPAVEKLLQTSPPTVFEIQEDLYYSHSCYNIKDAGKVLRRRRNLEYIRRKKAWQITENSDRLTYKGPVKKGAFKSREETEFEAPEELWPVLHELGFKFALSVRKHRWSSELEYRGSRLTLCLDRVEHLGYYLEVEIMTENEEKSRELLSRFILNHNLDGLHEEKRSYAEMLGG